MSKIQVRLLDMLKWYHASCIEPEMSKRYQEMEKNRQHLKKNHGEESLTFRGEP